MFGSAVHKAVIAYKETYSGISIHFVNEKYDEGQTLLQVRCKVDSGDTAESLAVKIRQLEHANYAPAIEKLLSNVK
jgi:phosphoribosylglycinamide formyltransferase-1